MRQTELMHALTTIKKACYIRPSDLTKLAYNQSLIVEALLQKQYGGNFEELEQE